MQIYYRQEHHDGGKGRCRYRTGHLGCTGYSGVTHRKAAFLVSEYTLNNHDGVIHQHTCTQRKTSQRQDVYGQSAEEHQVEGCYNGNRY